jgi:hypothetical protein
MIENDEQYRHAAQQVDAALRASFSATFASVMNVSVEPLPREVRASTGAARDRRCVSAPTISVRRGCALRQLTRQIEPDASSLTSSDPSAATVTPTGRPQTSPLSSTNPVRKSSYSPLACPV